METDYKREIFTITPRLPMDYHSKSLVASRPKKNTTRLPQTRPFTIIYYGSMVPIFGWDFLNKDKYFIFKKRNIY